MRLQLSSVHRGAQETSSLKAIRNLPTREVEEGRWDSKSSWAPLCIQGQAKVLGDAVSGQQQKAFSSDCVLMRQDVKTVIARRGGISFSSWGTAYVLGGTDDSGFPKLWLLNTMKPLHPHCQTQTVFRVDYQEHRRASLRKSCGLSTSSPMALLFREQGKCWGR